MTLMAIGGSVIPLYSLLGNTIIAHGCSGRYLLVSGVQLTIELLLALAALYVFGYMGPVGLLLVACFHIAYLFVWRWALRGLVRYTVGELLRDTMPYALTAFVVAAVVCGVTCLLPVHPLVLLAVRVVLTAGCYILALLLVHPAELKEAFGRKRGDENQTQEK